MDDGDGAQRSTGRTRRRLLTALGAGAAFGVAGCATRRETGGENGDGSGGSGGDGGDGGDGSVATTSAVTPQRTVEDPNLTPREGESRYTRVYRATVDSVVLIRVFTASGRGQGSGFVWDDRHIVTNQHVVENEQSIEVRFANGEWVAGEVVGADAYSDLAVVRVPEMPESATPLALVEQEPPVGTEVVAIGNPFGFGGSVSTGIVSGVNRSLPGPNNFQIADAVQTDAPVNPGNSGGPLVTLDGRVVGVVNSGGGDNIGFAISAALMKRVVPALIETGEYDHAYMGVRLLSVSPSIAEANDLETVTGVLIVDVVSGGPSDGVLQGATGEETVNGQSVPVGGDVVVRMGDTAIPDSEALSTFLALETSPGDTVPVEVIRDGRRETVQLTLGDRPDPRLSDPGAPSVVR